jgi:hypothetical protein
MSVETSIKIHRWQLSRVTKPSQFIEFVRPKIENPSKSYLRELAALAQESVDQFLQLNPTRREIRNLIAAVEIEDVRAYLQTRFASEPSEHMRRPGLIMSACESLMQMMGLKNAN